MIKQEIILDKIKHNDLMIEKYKKKCLKLNYVEKLLILASTVTVCILFSAFASLGCIPVGFSSFAAGINILCNHCRN